NQNEVIRSRFSWDVTVMVWSIISDRRHDKK
ncbi:MAG: hypothetical protein ACI8PB_005224, partial [Desulforhopalus sp.]